MIQKGSAALAAAVALTVSLVLPLQAQVGKSLGVVDVNTMAESELAGLPHVTPAVAKAVAAKRPFSSITELNALLLSQGLTQAQANAVYAKAFVHINLNTASREEIMLVPNAGKRMAHEFDEYRPWRSYAQFAKEIGKYVGADAAARLAQYTFIPMNANTAADEALLTIPGATPALVQRIKAGRPYANVAAVEAALAKDGNAAEARRIARYIVVQ